MSASDEVACDSKSLVGEHTFSVGRSTDLLIRGRELLAVKTEQGWHPDPPRTRPVAFVGAQPLSLDNTAHHHANELFILEGIDITAGISGRTLHPHWVGCRVNKVQRILDAAAGLFRGHGDSFELSSTKRQHPSLRSP